MNKSFDYLKNIFESALSDANRGDCQNGLATDQFTKNMNELTEGMRISWEAGGLQWLICLADTWHVSQEGRAMRPGN